MQLSGRKRDNLAGPLIRSESLSFFPIYCPFKRIVKNDFKISPCRYIHTGAADEYRPIAEIVEELNALEEEAKNTDAALNEILKRIGI